MDLYDDLDTKQRPGQIDGWSSGVKLLQTQLALKKATPIAQPQRRGDFAKRPNVLAPVMLLKSAKRDSAHHSSAGDDGDDIFKPHDPSTATVGRHKLHTAHFSTTTTTTTLASVSPLAAATAVATPSQKMFTDYDWDVVDEYDPLWPNEYEKLVKDRRLEEKHNDGGARGSHGKYHRGGGGHHNDGGRGAFKRRGPFGGAPNRPLDIDQPKAVQQFSGFGGRPTADEEDSYVRSPPASGGGRPSTGGAAIAPPASLQESTVIIPAGAGNASSVAAKIMARYGFRDGQGLGKQEQGMSMALQVEKTSKRGGRIIHERETGAAGDDDDAPLPSTLSTVAGAPAAAAAAQPQLMLPPSMVPAAVSGKAAKATEASAAATATAAGSGADEPSITEIMKAPSKVVLLRNMVGPGDVDADLEPEVKDECNTKYGDVVSVVINELQNVVPEEAVRIFVEFRRIESAIKAVVDLNGRFFGGRQVRAGFFGFDKYKAYQLYD